MYLKATKFREQVWLRYILIVNVVIQNYVLNVDTQSLMVVNMIIERMVKI